jgi:hypothetical protein
MADLLVQNASEKFAEQIVASSTKTPWNKILGTSIKAYLKAHIEANPNGGEFYSGGGGGGGGSLCDLSDPNKISDCECAYAGSGTSCTCNWGSNNVWTDGSILASGGGTTVTKTSHRQNIIAQDELINRAYILDNSVFDDDWYYAYLGLQADFTAAGATTILENWYGVSSGGGSQGKRLSETNYVKVCGSGSTWKCGVGATCTWTVPAGATVANSKHGVQVKEVIQAVAVVDIHLHLLVHIQK